MPVDPISGPLLRWYDAHARVLPWRSAPGSRAVPDPYRVWLAEIMLQQTTVAAVLPRYRRFLARWGDVQALAAADEGDVLGEWAGLGYYARARNLHACARAVVAQGGFPTTEAGLARLPGLGPYTAAAIAAIAFGAPAVVVDANVERVAARLFAIRTPLPAAKGAIRAQLEPHVPPDRPGDFAQAMMDLGAGICGARAPDCPACPLAASCAAHARGLAEQLPVKAARRVRPRRHATAWLVLAEGAVALVRRPPRGLLGGMLALPGSEFSGSAGASDPFPARWQQLAAPVVHGFTHFELHLDVRAAHLPERNAARFSQPIIWTPPAALMDAGLPTLYARAVSAALPLLQTGSHA